jgi:Icc-related predicted phosphoesterase
MTPRLPLYVVGDPHGQWNQIAAQLAHAPPGVVVTAGNHDLIVPYKRAVAPVLAAGHMVRWIPGNHDLEHGYDLLWGDAPEWDISGQVVNVGGWAIAGLGGVFRGKVWFPQFSAYDEAKVESRKGYLDRMQRTWTQGEFGDNVVLEIIFPDDIQNLSGCRADVLVTHEAPTCHRYGFAALDKLGADLKVAWHVHGHHHKDYAAVTPHGVAVQGLGIGQVWEVPWAGSENSLN